MMKHLEADGFLADLNNEAQHITQGYRSPQVAHRWSTAYNIINGGVGLLELRKTPVDQDGNIWYREEWDATNCPNPNPTGSYLYLFWKIIKNASDAVPAEAKQGWGYVWAGMGFVQNVPKANEGYPGNDQRRLPNILSEEKVPVSSHVTGKAVDIGNDWVEGVNWWDSRVDKIAAQYNFVRSQGLNSDAPEYWHFQRP